ncbi:hypothetical protein Tco_1268239 [Tanacetum coccineum]
MDENTVRLWLRDHQDAVEKLAQQHATDFQAQFDTLQETRRLLQNRQGAGLWVLTWKVRLQNGFDPHGALSKLLQLGTVEDYQREFEKLMNRLRELLVSNPTTLVDVFSLARSTEAYFEAIAHKEKETAKKAQTINVTTDTITSLRSVRYRFEMVSLPRTRLRSGRIRPLKRARLQEL